MFIMGIMPYHATISAAESRARALFRPWFPSRRVASAPGASSTFRSSDNSNAAAPNATPSGSSKPCTVQEVRLANFCKVLKEKDCIRTAAGQQKLKVFSRSDLFS